jgi:hypothetical protein
MTITPRQAHRLFRRYRYDGASAVASQRRWYCLPPLCNGFLCIRVVGINAQIRKGCEVVSSPHNQGGPRKGSQNSFAAAATALLMMSWRSGELILSSSSRLMIEPASRRTAGIRVDLSTTSWS